MWGALSANQSEGFWKAGGRGPSNIDYIPIGEHRNAIKLGEIPPYPTNSSDYFPSRDGIGFYNSYKEDILLLKEMGLKIFRTSISWSQLFPIGDEEHANQEGLDFYHNLFKECKKMVLNYLSH